MDLIVLAVLVALSFVAAFIDSIVGGGGVISLPALLAAGLPPHLALGTNKLAGTGASLAATVRYARAGVIVLPLALTLIPFSVAGGILGAAAILQIDARFVKGLVLAMMILMTFYVVLRKEFGARNGYAGPTRVATALAATSALLIGFYDGFLGPGTGSILLFAFLAIQRFDFVRAAGHGRVLNFASNAAALLWFALHGSIVWAVGLPMMVAMLAGAWTGSRYALKHGARWIKLLFVAVTSALLVRLFLTF